MCSFGTKYGDACYFVRPVVLWDLLFFYTLVYWGHTDVLHSRVRITIVLTVHCYEQDNRWNPSSTQPADLWIFFLLSLGNKMSFLHLDIQKKTSL